MRDRALFDLAIDSKLRGCNLVKIKIGTIVSAMKFEPAPWLFSKKPVARYNSRSRQKFGQAYSRGSNGEAERLTITPFPAESTPPIIRAPESMPDWSMNG